MIERFPTNKAMKIILNTVMTSCERYKGTSRISSSMYSRTSVSTEFASQFTYNIAAYISIDIPIMFQTQLSIINGNKFSYWERGFPFSKIR